MGDQRLQAQATICPDCHDDHQPPCAFERMKCAYGDEREANRLLREAMNSAERTLAGVCGHDRGADLLVERARLTLTVELEHKALAANPGPTAERLRELSEAKSRYIAALEKELRNQRGFLSRHGWHSPQAQIDEGKRLRAEIEALSDRPPSGEEEG